MGAAIGKGILAEGPTTNNAAYWFYKEDEMRTQLHEAELKKGEPGAPPMAPDLTDKLLRESRSTQLNRMGAKRGRKSTFLTGPMGDTSAKPLGKKTLLGGY